MSYQRLAILINISFYRNMCWRHLTSFGGLMSSKILLNLRGLKNKTHRSCKLSTSLMADKSSALPRSSWNPKFIIKEGPFTHSLTFWMTLEGMWHLLWWYHSSWKPMLVIFTSLKPSKNYIQWWRRKTIWFSQAVNNWKGNLTERIIQRNLPKNLIWNVMKFSKWASALN